MTARGSGSERLARRVESVLEDMKGQSISCFNVRKLTTITDYMVIVTGASRVHTKALAEELVGKMKRRGCGTVGVEGLHAAEWVLVDLGAVVVHIMLAPVRAMYNLEELWSLKPAGDGE